MQNTDNMVTFVPFYLPEQYQTLLEIADDSDLLEKTWEEWFKKHFIFKEEMKKKGLLLKEVVIDIEELHNYCIMNNVSNTNATRSIFTIQIASLGK